MSKRILVVDDDENILSLERTILEQKGFLKKRQEDRAYIYTPAQPQKQVVGGMVRDFVNRVFNGSAEPLLLHLVEDQHLTEKDLEEIRKTIRANRKKGDR